MNLRLRLPIAVSYRRAVFDAVILQVIFGVLSKMVLDGGKVAHTTGIAMLAFSMGVGLIIQRRPTDPTDWDLTWIRFGFLPLLVVTFAVAEWAWSWSWVWKIRGF